MALKVVGAGLGRTGTNSLKLALEQLLGGPCYHMIELFPRPDHVELWHDALKGTDPDWETMLSGFVATVDWPAVALWRQLHQAFPDALVLLSVRDTAQSWWRSFSETILQVMERGATAETAKEFAMLEDMLATLTPSYRDADAAMEAYEVHNQSVRDSVDPDRLIEWQPGDGWGPICQALGIVEPDDAFPHVNTTDDFRAMSGLADADGPAGP